MEKKALFLAFFLLFGCAAFQPDAPNEPPINPIPDPGNPAIEIETQIVAQDLDIPWAIDFLPNGKLIFTQREGKIKIIEEGTIHEVSGVTHLGESGLQGIAVDPEFEENNFIYVYYTYLDGAALKNKVSRFTLLNNLLSNETTLLEGIPGNVFHDGGRIKFGPDGMLYVTTGDAGETGFAQDKDSLAGKILRMNKDGSVPFDNPFGNLVYSMGHRNPQGLDWHPLGGGLFATEHGPSKHDEVNIIQKGQNYGWPEILCNQNPPQEITQAIICFDEWTMAPSGATFYSNDKLPFENQFIYGGLRGEQIRALTYENGKVVKDEKILDGFGRIREIVEGSDGWIYFATNNTDGRGTPKENDDKIYRIKIKSQSRGE